MPTYDYKCEECGEITTKQTTISKRKEVQTCEACGKEAAKHIITSVSFSLDPTDPGFAGTYDKWARDRERSMKAKKNNGYI